MSEAVPAIPGARFSFSVIHPGSPMLRMRYRDGIVVGPYGFPDWLPYARAVVEVSPAAPNRTVDETRVLDVLIANELMARSGDSLWRSGDGVATPPGWTWAHLAMTRQLGLVPAELHGAYRHLGGVSTLAGEHRRRGLDVGGAGPVALRSDERLTEDAVAKVEDHLGYRFPAAYRRFLAATNGGRPDRPAVHPGLGFVADQRFFGLAREDWLQDLVYANHWLDDRLTPDFLAIGYVQGGLVALKVRDVDAGSVWYWDDDDPRDTDEHGAVDVCGRLLHRVGDDFDGFVAALRAVPYPLRWLARETVTRGGARLLAPVGMGAGLPRAKRGDAGAGP